MAVPASQQLTGNAEAASTRLFEEHSERVLGYCLGTLGSRAEAEDAAQTTFLYAHRALERGVVPEHEYAWLHSIAKNVCRWQLRTLGRRGSLTSELDLDAFPSSAGADADVRVSELRDELDDALASIPESQRKALVLREWRGLESHEVAEQLGMSTTATYALLTRARKSVAKALSVAGSRPVLGIDFVAWLGKLKALLAGGAAKVAAMTTLAVGTVAAGGVADDLIVDDPDAPRDSRAPALETRATSAGSIADRLPTVQNPRIRAVSRNAVNPKSKAAGGSAPATSVDDPAAGPAPVSEGSAGTEGQPASPTHVPQPTELPTPAVALPVARDPVVPKIPSVALPPVDLPADDLLPPVGDVEDVLGDPPPGVPPVVPPLVLPPVVPPPPLPPPPLPLP